MIIDTDMVDSLSINEDERSQLLLVISDHLEWDNEYGHLLLMQEKLNNYINFITNDEYKETFDSEFNSFKIIIYVAYHPPKELDNFLAKYNKRLKKKVKYKSIEVVYEFLEGIEDIKKSLENSDN